MKRDVILDARRNKAMRFFQEGQLSAALPLVQELCQKQRNNAENWLLLTAITSQLGQLDTALDACQKAISLLPADARAYYSQGFVLEKLNQFQEAITSYRKALQLDKSLVAVHINLGNALHAVGQYREAIDEFNIALQYFPDDPHTYYNRGLSQQNANLHDDAIQSYRVALKIKPDYAEAYNNLGILLGEMGELQAAIIEFEKALHFRKDYAEAYANIGRILIKQKKNLAAISALEKAVALKPDDITLQKRLATACINVGNLDAAEQHYRKILLNDPDNITAIAGLCNILEKRGDTEKAWSTLTPHLETGNSQILSVYAAICNEVGKCDDCLQKIEAALLDDNVSSANRMQLHFEAGRLYDRKADYNRAFSHYQKGNMLETSHYDSKNFTDQVNDLIDAYTNKFMLTAPVADEHTLIPVFIVGMPRSGTSLVEQILASHPAMHAMGECEELNRITAFLQKTLDSPRKYPSCITDLNTEHCNSLAKQYFDVMAAETSSASHISDKMPNNFMHIGLIRMLFPGARIIHVVRNPIDTCLSCYFTSFAGNHPYSSSLENLINHYKQYQRLMRHWEQALNIDMHTLHYESLVTDTAKEVRELLEYCGLEWHAGCLEFHKNQRYVKTASYQQVRKKIYTDSIERWRNYEAYIGPLKQLL
jgi:tetratricopeptide (TPR) repeat protein